MTKQTTERSLAPRSISKTASILVGVLAMLLSDLPASAQARRPQNNGQEQKSQNKKQEEILPNVRAWRMTADFTKADTAVVDTIVAEHQIHNPVWRKTPACVTLGNLGAPSVATFYPAIRRDAGNVFYNALTLNMLDEEDYIFYNTTTPYANLTYQKGIPKRVREEFFSALFTQNVNKRLNVGMKLDLTAAIGRYEGQGVYNRKFGVWSSMDGDVYHYRLQGWYQRFEMEENGGILNDSAIIAPENYDYEDAQDVPVLMMDAKNRTASYRLLLAQQWDLGTVTRNEGDSVEVDVPVLMAHHKLSIDRSHNDFTVGNLATYPDSVFPTRLINNDYTNDDRKYMLVSNLFQVEMNEDFNTLLRFGLRGFIGNEVRQYRCDAPSETVEDEDGRTKILRHRMKKNNVSTLVGGQIFKNTGEHFFWDAGIRFYLQGYNVGDLTANGSLRLSIGNGTWRTDVWGKATMQLRSPTEWEERFCSNHYEWRQSLDREKTIDIRGGIRIPGVRLEATAFSATMHDRVFFGADGTPAQKSGVTQVVGAYVREHFESRIGFNSIIRATVQKTSDNDVVPLPTFAVSSSCYWEHLFFGVLLTQIGFDVRYNTKYYTPAYIPAIMQFVPQSVRETGGYGYFDPYVNFHLKKIRAYAKYEHVNDHWGSHDSFHTIGYPCNPSTFKFGLSWNFYD